MLFWVEIASFVLFAACLLEVRRMGAWRVVEFAMIAAYGLILEELDMRIFKTYAYSDAFFFTAGRVPVSIALLWAVILAGAMAFSDRSGLPAWARPFLDALLAVWLDLSIDAIAIRLGYWTWAIPKTEGWFGVPAGNLYAWMWVAFAFSALARLVRAGVGREGRWGWAYFLVPPVAYAALFGAMTGFGLLGRALGLTTQSGRLGLFWSQFGLFAGMILCMWGRRLGGGLRPAAVWVWSRCAIHAYFLGAYFLLSLYTEEPALGAVGAAVVGIEYFFMRKIYEMPLAPERGTV